ncbi:DUF58 domain-containing protein [Mycobacterium sp. NPDC050853]|uniref:DUF58 domain-containing protein n=1 Tax=Mycobacterium sp. NPDC050853 TaxID=3155160 RepID=UPI0033DD3387
MIGWRASPLVSALAACTAVALVLAVIAGRWQLILFASPFLGILVGAARKPAEARVWASDMPSPLRCLESETVTFTASVESSDAAVVYRLRPVHIDGLQITVDEATAPNQVTMHVSAPRWGRYTIAVEVHTMSTSGLWVGAPIPLSVAELRVYPSADPQDVALPPAELPDRIGTHLTRHHGSGVEYADIREYVPGDSLRTVNWRVSARRGRLHVTDRLTDRAADLVVLIDAYPQPLGPATTATERSARGAAQLVQSVLQRGDRAGVVVLGSAPRWLSPDIGRHQFYRVLDAILDAGEWHSQSPSALAPRAAMPPNSIVVAFSTLLNADFGLALTDLRRRGHPVLVVDVLDRLPFRVEPDPIVARWWRLERSRMYRNIAVTGVDVIAWSQDAGLNHAMHLIPQRQRIGRRR